MFSHVYDFTKLKLKGSGALWNICKDNGRIERSFCTDEETFYQVEDLPTDMGGLEAALLAWNQVHEQVQPHQSPGYKNT